jgi:hypothetical protein
MVFSSRHSLNKIQPVVGVFTAPPRLPTFTKSLYSIVHQGIEFFTPTRLNWQPLLQPDRLK